jgi:3'-phosphoadenosine 5'-phosphosulfate sulfotransferase (PAPS reductase)/FAD synthetase
VEIETVIDPNPKFRNRNVWERIKNRGKFPRDNARFCTQQLKIGVSARYYNQLLTLDGYKNGYHVWYGMRGIDESLNRTKKYGKYVNDELIKPNDMNTSFPKKLAKQGVYFVLPVVNWSTKDVFDFLGNDVNPLYKSGFKRVGCFPCFACATPKQLENAYNFDDFGKEQKRKVVEMEKELGIVHQNSNTAQVCMWCEI